MLGTAGKLGLDRLLDRRPSRKGSLAPAMIAGHVLDPRSKLATARGLGSDTLVMLKAAPTRRLWPTALIPTAAARRAKAAERLPASVFAALDPPSALSPGRPGPQPIAT